MSRPGESRRRGGSCCHRNAGRRGYSLLEVLLAVSLGTMLLVAVNFFVLSMGELWGGGSEARLFDRHVRGVTRFLEALVQQSVVPVEDPARPAADAPPVTRLVPQRRLSPATPSLSTAWLWTGVRGGPSAVAAACGMRLGWGLGAFLAQAMPGDEGGMGRLPAAVRDAGPDRPPEVGVSRGGQSTAADSLGALATGARFRFGTPSGYDGLPPMLLFEVDEAPGQCVWPERPLPQVECALQINRDEGLVLLWKSKLEEDYGKARPRKTQLSPFGQALSFDYYDAERQSWQHTEQPLPDGNGGWLVPHRLRVTFVYESLTREISITLPDTPGGAPLR